MTVPDPLVDHGYLTDGQAVSVTLDDLAGIFTQHRTHHIGFPKNVVIDFPENILTPRIRPLRGGPRAGDVYLFTVDQLATAAAHVPGFTANLVEDALIAVGRLSAAEAVNVVGLLPLAWHVPPTTGEDLMAVPAHVRMVWSGVFGTVGAPAEIWSWGLNAGTATPAQTQADLDSAATLMHTLWASTLKDMTGNNITLTQTLYARVAAGGHVERGTEGEFHQSKLPWAEVGGVPVTKVMPLQTALCVSLNTARAGQTGKGRSFLPLQNEDALQADFRMDPIWCAGIASRFHDLITGLNAIGGPVSVVSAGALIKGPPVSRTPGYTSRVTSVRVGRVPDTMRSRRDNLVEGYVSSAPIA